MSRRARLRLGVGLAAAAVVVAAMAAALALGGPATPGPALVVTDDAGTELLSVPVAEGTEVTVEYTHSVERTPVTDVYVVDDGALVMDRMLFSSYGAGLPAQAPVEREGDRYVYRPPEQRHETLRVATGPVAGHELVVDGERYDLVALADGGTIRIRVERRFPLGP